MEAQQVVVLILQFGVVIYDRVLSIRNPKEWRNDEMRFPECTTQVNSEGKLEIFFSGHKNNDRLTASKKKFQNCVKKIDQIRQMNKTSSLNIFDTMNNNIIDQEIAKEQSSARDYKYNPLLTKYRASIVLMSLVIFLVYVFLPLQGNYKLHKSFFCNSFFKSEEETEYLKCNNTKDNQYILIFYSLYCAYFCCCALQVKYGQYKERYTDLLNGSYIRLVGMYTIKFLPFLLELKIIIEWFMAKTALTLTSWIKLEDIFINVFLYQTMYKRRIKGREQPFFMKLLMGFGSFFAISMVLIFPLILFSDLNPISDPDLIESFDYEFGFKIGESTYFEIIKGESETNISKISNPSFPHWFILLL